MAGIIPTPLKEVATLSTGGQSGALRASLLVAYVTDLLSRHIQAGQVTNSAEVSNLCLFLARSIDYAVANNEVPSKAQDLPLLLKQVYKCKNDSSLQAAVMVLMISVKNACRIGWFPNKDTDDLLVLAKEIGRNFCSMENVNVESSSVLPYISEIMSRFYPHIKMGSIISSLEVKPGYGAFAFDFHILRSVVVPMQAQIGLFVAQTDNMDTSSCIVTPPKVSFLLNGRGVRGRINVSMDNGPQLPTNVTPMLKYGTNLLQAVGQFNGHYIIIIAFMSVVSPSETPVLQEYVQPAVTTLDSDSEIIEGPSRISLNCPISCRRIKTPVKGHLCKHHQCFDYDNFMEMNSRRPSWRCPHCNQSVCYPDIRIDQNIVKVLREVGENVLDVIISADGSWKSVLESKDHTDQAFGRIQTCQQEKSDQCEHVTITNISTEVVDLTEGGHNEIDGINNFGAGDGELLWDNLQGFSSIRKTLPPAVNSTNMFDQNASAQMEGDFWSGILSTTTASCDLAAVAASSDAQMGYGIPNTTAFGSVHSPVATDAISPALGQESGNLHQVSPLSISLLQNQISISNYLQLQRFRFVSPVASNEYGRLPSMPTNVSRTPIAVQGPPSLAQISSSSQQTRTLNSLTLIDASSVTSQRTQLMAANRDGCTAINGGTERDLQFSRPMDTILSSMQHHSGTQNQIDNDWHYISGQSVQEVVGLPTQGLGATALRPANEHQNLKHPNVQDPRKTHAMTRPQSLVLPSIRVQPAQPKEREGSQATVTLTNKQPLPKSAAQKTAQVWRTPPLVPVQLQASKTDLSFDVVAERLRTTVERRRNMNGTTQPLSKADGLLVSAADQNWRPSGRMRGSLRGEAYSAALSQFMSQVQPSQPAQASQSPSNLPSTSHGHGAPPGQGLATNGTSALNNSQAQADQGFGNATNCSGSSGTLPERSLGMH